MDIEKQWRHDLDMKLVCFIETGEVYVAAEGYAFLHLYGRPKGNVRVLYYYDRDRIRLLTDEEIATEVLFDTDIIQLQDKFLKSHYHNKIMTPQHILFGGLYA